MKPPYVNYVTWNRMGLTARNLTRLLETTDDFALHIVDSSSSDNTWDFLQNLKDRRIKSVTRFDKNKGPIYAANYALSQRDPDQYFFTIDSDVYINTNSWVSKFMEVFETFPEVGLLGVVKGSPYPPYLPPVLFNIKNGVSYLQLKNASIIDPLDFVPGHFQCLRPELLETIGYWSEENHYGDAELSVRVVQFTPFSAGYVNTVEIDQVQQITCDQCKCKELCSIKDSEDDCFSLRDKDYRNPLFAMKYFWKHLKTYEEMKNGIRSAYCASIHDEESMKNHLYYKDWAMENFNFYK